MSNLMTGNVSRYILACVVFAYSGMTALEFLRLNVADEVFCEPDWDIVVTKFIKTLA